MFCPKCGKADQVPETYCRQCGTFLPDLSKPYKKEVAPEEHIKINSVLSVMTVVVCFVLAGLLYATLAFRPETPVLIYATAGLLIAMGGWHVQSFIRIRKLKKQWSKRNPNSSNDSDKVLQTSDNAPQLGPADFENSIPASVTDRTTRHLSESKIKSS